jgi:hypothetical protein
MTDEPWIEPLALEALTGSEAFLGLDATVIDFWRFALSDLRMNNARGYLAEFLVARAVGSTMPRVEWDAYDVLTPDGVKIEVKSAAYLQAWRQKKVSTIQFTGLASRTWAPETGYTGTPSYNADVYVFALLTGTTHGEYAPLDVRMWEFYVLPRRVLETRGQKTMRLSTVQMLAGKPCTLDSLAEAVTRASVDSSG